MFTTAQPKQTSTMLLPRLSYAEYKALDPLEQKKYKAEILNELREFHKPLINNLGVSSNDFQFKVPFYHKGIQVIGVFNNEFTKQKGLFFEMFDREFNPTDKERTVYNVAHNVNYEEEYEINQNNSYLVPLDELRVVNSYSVAISGESAIVDAQKKTTGLTYNKPAETKKEEVEQYNDALFSEMTIRDYYAMQTGKPLSLKPWLNDLIKSTINK
jgi:hypothetical protein